MSVVSHGQARREQVRKYAIAYLWDPKKCLFNTGTDLCVTPHRPYINYYNKQGAKLLGSRVSETPKNGGGNPKFGPGFPTGNPEKMV